MNIRKRRYKSMENFVDKLDSLYKKLKRKNNIKKNDIRYSIYLPISVERGGKIDDNFLVKKSEFTKFLFIKDGARVYFSDADILTMLLQLERRETMQLILEELKALYRGKGKKYNFYIANKPFEGVGISKVKDTQVLKNPQDIDILFDEMVTLINIILAKDSAAEPLWRGKYEFAKHTIVKYISLLQYYYFKDTAAKNYLSEIGYDFKHSIYENYSTHDNREKNNARFYDFKTFEKAGIV